MQECRTVPLHRDHSTFCRSNRKQNRASFSVFVRAFESVIAICCWKIPCRFPLPRFVEITRSSSQERRGGGGAELRVRPDSARPGRRLLRGDGSAPTLHRRAQHHRCLRHPVLHRLVRPQADSGFWETIPSEFDLRIVWAPICEVMARNQFPFVSFVVQGLFSSTFSTDSSETEVHLL